MARKRSSNNPFENVESQPAEGYADMFARIQDDRVDVQPLPLKSIWADPTQPRRQVPSRVRAAVGWDGDPKKARTTVGEWQNMAYAESGINLDFGEFLEVNEGNGEADVERDKHPLTASLLDLIDLSNSIYRDGLTNPITIYKSEGGYRIQTGERRWMAFHLLSIYDTGFNMIPARVVERNIRQMASENTARVDLNSIGMARQLALVLMDMVDAEFSPYDALVEPGTSDRPFYAQAMDYKSPNGMGSMVRELMGGLTSRHLQNFRKLWSLDDEAWMRFDDESTPLTLMLTYMKQRREMPVGEFSIDDVLSAVEAARQRSGSDNLVSTNGSNSDQSHEIFHVKGGITDGRTYAKPTGVFEGARPSTLGRDRKPPTPSEGGAVDDSGHSAGTVAQESTLDVYVYWTKNGGTAARLTAVQVWEDGQQNPKKGAAAETWLLRAEVDVKNRQQIKEALIYHTGWDVRQVHIKQQFERLTKTKAWKSYSINQLSDFLDEDLSERWEDPDAARMIIEETLEEKLEHERKKSKSDSRAFDSTPMLPNTDMQKIMTYLNLSRDRFKQLVEGEENLDNLFEGWEAVEQIIIDYGSYLRAEAEKIKHKQTFDS